MTNTIETTGASNAARTETVICVSCPCGCEMTVDVNEQGIVTKVVGNECARGVRHAEDEVVAPARVITLCLCVPGILEPLSVKTAASVPKSLMTEAKRQIEAATTSITLPIASGDIVLEDVCNTGIPVIATKSLG